MLNDKTLERYSELMSRVGFDQEEINISIDEMVEGRVDLDVIPEKVVIFVEIPKEKSYNLFDEKTVKNAPKEVKDIFDSYYNNNKEYSKILGEIESHVDENGRMDPDYAYLNDELKAISDRGEQLIDAFYSDELNPLIDRPDKKEFIIEGEKTKKWLEDRGAQVKIVPTYRDVEGMNSVIDEMGEDTSVVFMAHSGDTLYGQDPLALLPNITQNPNVKECFLGSCYGGEYGVQTMEKGLSKPFYSTTKDKKWWGFNASNDDFVDAFFGIDQKDTSTSEAEHQYTPFKIKNAVEGKNYIKRLQEPIPRATYNITPIQTKDFELEQMAEGGIVGETGPTYEQQDIPGYEDKKYRGDILQTLYDLQQARFLTGEKDLLPTNIVRDVLEVLEPGRKWKITKKRGNTIISFDDGDLSYYDEIADVEKDVKRPSKDYMKLAKMLYESDAITIDEGAWSINAARAIPEHTNKELKSFVKNWYNNPATKKRYEKSGGAPESWEGVLNSINSNIDSVYIAKLPEGVSFYPYNKEGDIKIHGLMADAYYDPNDHTILHPNPNERYYTHEVTHAAHRGEYLGGDEDIVNIANEDYIKDHGNDEAAWYYTDTKEVVSRIMSIREEFGLKPDQEVTKEDLDRMKKEVAKDSQLSDLLKFYEEDGIIYLLNNIVEHSTTEKTKNIA